MATKNTSFKFMNGKEKQRSLFAGTSAAVQSKRFCARRIVRCACFRVIRANGKVEQHILIFDPAELHSLKANVFIELYPGDRLEPMISISAPEMSC
jgi:hypothetical protein